MNTRSGNRNTTMTCRGSKTLSSCYAIEVNEDLSMHFLIAPLVPAPSYLSYYIIQDYAYSRLKLGCLFVVLAAVVPKCIVPAIELNSTAPSLYPLVCTAQTRISSSMPLATLHPDKLDDFKYLRVFHVSTTSAVSGIHGCLLGNALCSNSYNLNNA
jgi:hypothetical protein